MDLSGTVNVDLPAAFGGHITYLASSDFASSTTMIEHKIEGEFGIERIDGQPLALKESARVLLETKRYSEFRERYGDYFIAGVGSGYKFQAIITCK